MIIFSYIACVRPLRVRARPALAGTRRRVLALGRRRPGVAAPVGGTQSVAVVGGRAVSSEENHSIKRMPDSD